MNNTTSSVRFTLNFANKAIVGTKASFDKASKGFGPIYEELARKMAEHPDYACVVKEPKKPVKDKQTYGGMDIEFMLDYASAVGQPVFRANLERVRDFIKAEKGAVYPTVKRMFLEHFAGKGNRFAYARAKVIVSDYRFHGIITRATEHTEPIEAEEQGEALAPVVGL